MALIVQKFGGTSVADIECIRNAAKKVKRELDQGNQVAVVVSAMSGVTDQLVDWACQANARPTASEYDVVVASGEQVTTGLFSLMLQGMGIPARSYLGWQIPIKTDGRHSKARIESIEINGLRDSLAKEVAIVAGFQGVSETNRITTLGRGGTDTSAVALAAALGADRCDIYTDVDGVYTADPRIVSSARKLDKITYEEMLELASQGAKVLQTRSVEIAMRHNVPLRVLSSFNENSGTCVVGEDEIMEKELVSGITYSRDEAKISLIGIPDKPGMASVFFGPLADEGINVDMIVKNVAEKDGTADLTFTVPRDSHKQVLEILKTNGAKDGYKRIVSDPNVAKISVVGVGMRSHAGVARAMFDALGAKGIDVQVISTSEIKISVLVAEEYTELAVRALHAAYELEAKIK